MPLLDGLCGDNDDIAFGKLRRLLRSKDDIGVVWQDEYGSGIRPADRLPDGINAGIHGLPALNEDTDAPGY